MAGHFDRPIRGSAATGGADADAHRNVLPVGKKRITISLTIRV
jgi:hypothetical protein